MIVYRHATRADVPAIVALLADDMLGSARETVSLDQYLQAFDRMAQEGGNHVIVAEDAGEIVASYQITFISGLSLSAARRALIESVRVASAHRNRGLGDGLMRDAEARARQEGCSLIQFTTNKARTDAHRFYDRLGFTPSHIGYKKQL